MIFFSHKQASTRMNTQTDNQTNRQKKGTNTYKQNNKKIRKRIFQNRKPNIISYFILKFAETSLHVDGLK